MKIFVFKNENKKKENSPDYSIMTPGEDKLRRVGGLWIRTSKTGKSYMGGMIDLPEDKPKEINGAELPF